MKSVKCEICNKVFDNSRPKQSLILHMERAHNKRYVDGEFVDKTEVDRSTEGEWRLLNPNDSIERDCINAGFTEIQEMAGVQKVEWELR